MKKTKRQKAADWKHLMAPIYGYTPIYLARKFQRMKQRSRFNLSHFAKTVNILFRDADRGDFPSSKRGDSAWVHTKNTLLNYRDMKFSICGLRDGITK